MKLGAANILYETTQKLTRIFKNMVSVRHKFWNHLQPSNLKEHVVDHERRSYGLHSFTLSLNGSGTTADQECNSGIGPVRAR